MKKFLSLTIALLMLFSCISVSAETTDTEKTNESFLYEHALSTGALHNGLTDTSEYQYTFRDFGRVGEYSLCYMAGTLTHEVDFNTTIGNYKISTKQERIVNPLGLYLVKGETVHNFDKTAYDNGIINQEELDQIISILNENISDDIFKGWIIKEKGLADTQDFCDVVNDYIINSGNGAYLFEQHITDKEDGTQDITYSNLLTPENVKTRFLKFYKESETIVVFGIPGSAEAIATEQIGDYIFTASSTFDPVNKCGYCVYYDGSVFSIADAVAGEIITVEELAQIIPYTKHISELPSEDLPTTEPITIPSEPTDTAPSTTPSEPKETEPATKPAEPTEKTAVTVKDKNIKSGEKVKAFKVVNPKNEKVTYTPRNSKIATVNNKGYVTGLKKGTAKFVVKVGKKSFNCSIKVTSDPKLTKNNKKVKTVVVAKNKTVKVRIVGKAKGVKNTYKNTSKAKVISNRNAEVIKIKGLKKGTTNLKITVNGKKLNLKVRVK